MILPIMMKCRICFLRERFYISSILDFTAKGLNVKVLWRSIIQNLCIKSLSL